MEVEESGNCLGGCRGGGGSIGEAVFGVGEGVSAYESERLVS